MWFGEPHPSPVRGSPTRLSASGQQGYEGWSCRPKYSNITSVFRCFNSRTCALTPNLFLLLQCHKPLSKSRIVKTDISITCRPSRIYLYFRIMTCQFRLESCLYEGNLPLCWSMHDATKQYRETEEYLHISLASARHGNESFDSRPACSIPE